MKPPAQRIYVIFQGCCTYKGQTLTVGETWGQADMAKTSRPVRAIATTYLLVNYVATRTIFGPPFSSCTHQPFSLNMCFIMVPAPA